MAAIPRIAVTGAAGQLGIHTRLWLGYHHGCEIVPIDRKAFTNRDTLTDSLKGCEAVIHLAGVNRGEDGIVESANIKLAEKLGRAIDKAAPNAHLVYASTIQIDRDNAYGSGKRKAGRLLAASSETAGRLYSEIVLPNLFGEFSRPDYNNFTGTFCARICEGREIPVNDPTTQVELMHYGDAAEVFHDCISTGKSGTMRPLGIGTSVGVVAETLAGFHDSYSNGVVPDIRDQFDLRLFNMLRSFMFEQSFPARLQRHADERGSFFECIRSLSPGQTSFSATVPGITRGNHFHFRKVERFLVLSGTARISVRRLSDDHTWHFEVSGEEPVYIDMPTLHTHNITNIGQDELLTLFWTNDFFDPQVPDTYAEVV